MTISTANIKVYNSNDELLEKVILQNDLAGLSPIEKVQHIKNTCNSLGLNPLTKPIQLIKFQGKEIPYMTKDGAEQIRNLHNVSITRLETEVLNGNLYLVKAYASKPNGRQDCSTSAISIEHLKSIDIGNAMKKCETQAKRRVTLSICGLGMLDESEIDDLPKPAYHQKIDLIENKIDLEKEHAAFAQSIENCEDIQSLQKCFIEIKSKDFKSRPDLLQHLIDKKDEKKNELISKNIDQSTGEINNETTL
jgi:hypothetical protein